MRRLFPLAALIALAGCGTNELAGGGIETNNTLSLKVTDAAGTPVAGAVVNVRPDVWHGPETPDAPGFTGRTDSAGNVTASLDAGRWILESRTAGLGRMAGLRSYYMQQLAVTLALDSFGGLDGFIALDTPIPVRIALGGTPRETRTDSLGRYRLDSLSPGPLLLRLLDGSGRTDSVQILPGRRDTLPWTGDPVLRRPPGDGAVLLDDFRDTLPRLTALVPAAKWYLATDAKQGGNSSIQDADSVPTTRWGDLLTGHATASLGLVLGTAKPSGIGRYAQVGLVLAPDSGCIDLSTLDSVSFVARGSGSLRLDFRTALQDTLNDYASSPGVTFKPDGNWKRLRLQASGFAPLASSSHPEATWARSRHCVVELRLVALMSAQLELGDLVLHGPARSVFLAPARP